MGGPSGTRTTYSFNPTIWVCKPTAIPLVLGKTHQATCMRIVPTLLLASTVLLIMWAHDASLQGSGTGL